MSNRIKISENQVENVVGGLLLWEGGIVHPLDDPNAKYSYTDYTACQQWLVANWDSAQKEDCLIAMESVGLVKKI